MTPPSAKLPQIGEPPPRTTSMRSMLPSGMRLQVTWPENGSLSGTPSMSTSVRPVFVGPMPRIDTPWSETELTTLLDCRSKLNPGTWRSTSSSRLGADNFKSFDSKTVMFAAMSETF